MIYISHTIFRVCGSNPVGIRIDFEVHLYSQECNTHPLQQNLVLVKHLVLQFVLIYADCAKPYIKAMLIYTSNGKTIVHGR